MMADMGSNYRGRHKYFQYVDIKSNEMSRACSTYGGEEGYIHGFGGKPEGKRPLGRPRHRWEDIKMDLQEVGCGGTDWIELAQDKDRLPAPISFSKRTLLHGVIN